jgi:hypothetical protein
MQRYIFVRIFQGMGIVCFTRANLAIELIDKPQHRFKYIIPD